MEVGYPEASIEKSILKAALVSMNITVDSIMEDLTAKMIEVANEIRKLFIGGSDGAGELR
jgi:cobaltochelatase CobS